MRFLLDENFPKSGAQILEARAHEAIDSREVCGFGACDSVASFEIP